MWWLVWLGCSAGTDVDLAGSNPDGAAVLGEQAPGAAWNGPWAKDPGADDYSERIAAVAAIRKDLAAEYAAASTKEKPAVLKKARAAALDGLTGEILPAWIGTEWAFYGTTQTPRQGQIACGYFVTTTLRDAGFKVERAKLAQQASSHIADTLAGHANVKWLGNDVDAAVAYVEARGEGLWVVGLDVHVGYLWYDGNNTWMCHASYLGDGTTTCEDARTSPAMVSNVHVVAPLFNDRMLERWLTEKSFVTVTK